MPRNLNGKGELNSPWLWGGLALLAWAGVSAYYRYRPQPTGVNGAPARYRVPAEDIEFLYDLTWHEDDERRSERQIAARLIELIRRAREFVLMDVFLFNLHHVETSASEPVTREISRALAEHPHRAFFITDPLNTTYGTEQAKPLHWLHRGGTEVCITDLRRLRDNNLVYSPFWRVFLQWFGTGRSGPLENPLKKGDHTTVRALLWALNFKGNHRKVIVSDAEDGYYTLITSSNLADASAYFLNTGVVVRSQAVARHYLEAEKAVARMSGHDFDVEIAPAEDGGDAVVTPLMGDRIKQQVCDDIGRAGPGDELYVCTLFLADRDVIEAIVAAAGRGVHTTVVLDQNKTSFGEPKMGFPNQVTAAELHRRADSNIRWANTRGEEFHTKLVAVKTGDRLIVNTGSANLSRRSLSNTNLEANIHVDAPRSSRFARQVTDYLDRITREPHTLDIDKADYALWEYVWYRIMETSGLATF